MPTQAQLVGIFNELQCELGSGFVVPGCFGNPSLFAPRGVLAPSSRQVQAAPNQTGISPSGQCRENSHLAVVYFAQPTTILPRDAHRMLALLRKGSGIENKGKLGTTSQQLVGLGWDFGSQNLKIPW